MDYFDFKSVLAKSRNCMNNLWDNVHLDMKIMLCNANYIAYNRLMFVIQVTGVFLQPH